MQALQSTDAHGYIMHTRRVVLTLTYCLLGLLHPYGSEAIAARRDQSAVTTEALIDLSHAVIVTRPGTIPAAERTAARVLQEELAKRGGGTAPVQQDWPRAGEAPVVVVLASGLTAGQRSPWPMAVPADTTDGTWRKAEGYRVLTQRAHSQQIVWILGVDARGTLFGVGAVLRALRWDPERSAGTATGIPATLAVATAPAYALRGHQLGYRSTANSYDGWDAAQYEQYIRELALFGANAVENIPFQDTRVSPHFTLPRDEMNRAISAVCAAYDLDYWLWIPADFDLTLADMREASLTRIEQMAAGLPRLDAIFVPGGDPGANPAPLVLPYMRDIAARVRRHHPRATVWVSLQQFRQPDRDWLFAQLDGPPLDWFGGLVGGPSSPPLETLRARLPARYPLRDYPDITHVVRAQFPLSWDPAFNFTLGREPVNPRPDFYAQLHARVAPSTIGSITYSDGIHDDVNKVVWTQRAWAPDRPAADILRDYTRLFFGSVVAERAAEGLASLERNWVGPLRLNDGVDATLALWQALDQQSPALAGNWRWQMALLRAHYDAYTKQRQAREVAAELAANQAMLTARRVGAAAAIAAARDALQRAVDAPCCRALRERIDTLTAALFTSIRLQTSVERYGASGAERGAVLDFVDHPLNNRWWLDDEYTRIASIPEESARIARLELLASWDAPGAGSFYDDIGNIANSPHVVPRRDATALRSANDDANEDDDDARQPTPHFVWEDQGRSHKRLSWQTSLRWPPALVYERLDPRASYLVRLNGTGDIRLRIDGTPAEASAYSQTLGEFKDYPVPAAALADGRLELTFDPIDERDKNWRQHSRLSEAWLLKTPAPSR